MRVFNVHQRCIAAEIEKAGTLLDGLGSDQDRFWPWERWPAQRFDRALGQGAQGGHGQVRYAVDLFEPGRTVRYRFLPGIGLHGQHWFALTAEGDHVWIRHVIDAEAPLWPWLRWALVVRWLHDELIEDAFDKAEQDLTGSVTKPRRWAAWVRLVRWALGKTARRTHDPDSMDRSSHGGTDVGDRVAVARAE